MKKVGVLGCGWLGMPLAKMLIKEGYLVHGATTTPQKMKQILELGVTPFLVECTENSQSGLSKFIQGLDTLVLTIPPGLKKHPTRRHDLVIEGVIKQLSSSKIKHLIFISSTSVYGNQTGIINEQSPLLPSTNSGKQLVTCETLLRKIKDFNSTIIRFGGLIGPKRHPIFTLIKKPYLNNPNGEINLIHLDDCLKILLRVIEKDSHNTIYNAVNPYHPSRKNYYNQMAQKAELKCPPFNGANPINRIISSDKIQKELDITFSVENLLTLN